MNAKYIALLLPLFLLSMSIQASIITTPQVKQEVLSKSKIDLNSANLSILTGSFKGIGKKRAEAIIAYRDSHHGFKSLEELAAIKGFGQHFVEKNREKLQEVFRIN